MKTEIFYFEDRIVTSTSDICVAELENLRSEEDIYNAYYTQLKFPDYFGFNWDALWDCLSDLDWIKEVDVIIYHQEFPKLESKDLEIYLRILRKTVIHWKKYEEHNFIVYFKEKDYDVVKRFIEI